MKNVFSSATALAAIAATFATFSPHALAQTETLAAQGSSNLIGVRANQPRVLHVDIRGILIPEQACLLLCPEIPKIQFDQTVEVVLVVPKGRAGREIRVPVQNAFIGVKRDFAKDGFTVEISDSNFESALHRIPNERRSEISLGILLVEDVPLMAAVKSEYWRHHWTSGRIGYRVFPIVGINNERLQRLYRDHDMRMLDVLSYQQSSQIEFNGDRAKMVVGYKMNAWVTSLAGPLE